MGTFDMECIKKHKKLLVCGNVDDGKSTFLGRFFYDAGLLYEDQISKLKNDSIKKGLDHLDYSLVFDGLENEFINGITIDNSYKYFYLNEVKYILIDTPGHDEYLGNMASAAADADIAIVVVDSSRSISDQLLKHLFMFSVFGIKDLIILFNKMDIVGFQQKIFESFREKILNILSPYDFNYTFIPVSSFYGDNVVNYSERIGWYKGPTVFEAIQKVELISNSVKDLKVFVQNVVNKDGNTFAYCCIESGVLNVNEKYQLNNNEYVVCEEIYHKNNVVLSANEGMSICLRVPGENTLKRGDCIHKKSCYKSAGKNLSAYFICFNKDFFVCEKSYTVKRSFNYETIKFNSFENVSMLSTDNVSKPMNNIYETRFSFIDGFDNLIAHSYESKLSGTCIVVDENNNTLGILLIK